MSALPLLEFYCEANVNSVQVHVYSVLHIKIVIYQQFRSYRNIEQLPKTACQDYL